MSIKAILLDIDGTLLDSNDAHSRAWVEAIAEAGTEVHYDAIRPLIGKGGDKLLREVLDVDAESSEGKALTARSGELFRQRYLKTLAATSGARDLLVALAGRGCQLIVATSARMVSSNARNL